MDTRRFARLPAIVTLALVAAAVAAPARVVAGVPTPIIVNSTGDGADATGGSGACNINPLIIPVRCTLRAAIQTANSDVDEDVIQFGIDGTGVHVIAPATELPTVSDPLIIKGYSQPGSTPNTASKGTNAKLRIVLDGNGADFDGLTAEARVKVRGLVIQAFDNGIFVDLTADGSVIAGNFVGTNAAGTVAIGNGLQGIIANAADVTIGGPNPADRNVISGNAIGIFAPTGVLGGLKIQGNLIGVGSDGTTPLPQYLGITVLGAGGGLIGGNAPGMANVIANHTAGIWIGWAGQDAQRFTVARNSMYANTQGIDLGGDGVTPNDAAPDADGGPNSLQNFPGIGSAKTVGGDTTIKGTLRSTPTRTFDLRFYSSGPGAGGGQGRVFLVKRSVTTNANGRADFSFVMPSKVPIGRVVTATATDRTTRSTSEFSVARTVTGP